ASPVVSPTAVLGVGDAAVSVGVDAVSVLLLVLLSWLLPPHPTSRAYVVAAITRRPPRSASGRAFPGVAKRLGSITPQDSTGLWALQHRASRFVMSRATWSSEALRPKKDGPEVADVVSSVRSLRPPSFEKTVNDRVKLHDPPDFVDRAYLVFCET